MIEGKIITLFAGFIFLMMVLIDFIVSGDDE